MVVALVFFANWLANPVLWLGLVLYITGQRRWAMWAGSLALGLGLLVLPFVWDQVRHYPGYWVWLGSLASLLVGSLVCRVVAGPAVEGSRAEGDKPRGQTGTS